MELLTIENLCIAAEATVVLLLLAFTWRPQKKSEESCANSESGTISWEPAKAAFLQSNLFRGLYLNQLKSKQHGGESHVAPIARLLHSEDDSPSIVPEPWRDKLTGLLNRTGIDSILHHWISIDPDDRGVSCISMLTITSYAELARVSGAMNTERALRTVAKQVIHDLANSCAIARYQPDRFVVLHFASQMDECHHVMEQLQRTISGQGFFECNGSTVNISCVVTLVDLDDPSELAAKMESLDEGFVKAVDENETILSLVKEEWTNSPPAAANRRADGPSSSKLKERVANGKPESRELDEDSVAQSSQSHSDDADEESETKQSGDDSTEADASNDISAVASPDDIAALFAQINSNKSGAKTGSGAAAQPAASSTSPPQPPEPTELSDTVSADDIAALFASAKGKTPEPSKPAPAPEPKPADQGDLTESASSDDIAAMFASAKSAAPASKPAAKAAPAPATPPVDLTESASADDIAAMFASAKSTPAAPKPAPAPAAAAPPVDLTESASADDIAALFASAKPAPPTPKPAAPAAAAPTPVSPVPAAPVPATPPVDLTESASADDIAAMFASAKSTPAAPKPTPTPAPAAPPVDLTESASADDIAALFASAKPAAPAPKPAPAPPAAPAPVAPPVDLTESASADDIAALFASA